MRRHTDSAQIASPIEWDDELCRLYHENSKLWPNIEAGKSPRRVSHEELLAPVEASGSSFTTEGRALQSLARPPITPVISLGEAIVTRRSSAAFADVSLELSQVARLLVDSYRVTGDIRTSMGHVLLRSAPSAGGLYPVGVYLAAANIKGLARGVYRYDPVTTSLMTRLVDNDIAQLVRQMFKEQERAHHAAGAVMLTAHFARTIAKYGERGYRYVLLEAGHIAQLMSLSAVPAGVALRCYGAFYDGLADRLVGVDGRTECVIYVLLIGGDGESDVVGQS